MVRKSIIYIGVTRWSLSRDESKNILSIAVPDIFCILVGNVIIHYNTIEIWMFLMHYENRGSWDKRALKEKLINNHKHTLIMKAQNKMAKYPIENLLYLSKCTIYSLTIICFLRHSYMFRCLHIILREFLIMYAEVKYSDTSANEYNSFRNHIR